VIVWLLGSVNAMPVSRDSGAWLPDETNDSMQDAEFTNIILALTLMNSVIDQIVKML